MAEPFEIFRYMSYLRLRWEWIVVSAAVAVALAAGHVTLPKQYTATARILIEPPAGTDLRSAMAVSPIYLESLKTYEHFASSDSLFQKALTGSGCTERAADRVFQEARLAGGTGAQHAHSRRSRRPCPIRAPHKRWRSS